MASTSNQRPEKKRKVDAENRGFKDEWKLEFFFQLGPSNKPVCLICGTVIAVLKRANLKRHHETNHASWKDKYPMNSDTRQKKLDALLDAQRRSTIIMTSSMSQQEKAAEASLRIAWILNKKKMPLDSSETVKECIIAASQAVSTKDTTAAFEKIPLSNDTNTRRTEKIAINIKESLITKLKAAPQMSICIDESVDITDIPQLVVFVRFLDGKAFREELLALIPLPGRTTGEDIFNAVKSFFEQHGIPLNRISSLVTDGAPSMVGKEKGFTARLREINPNLLSYHCIIHNSVLCSKLNPKCAEHMDLIIKLVNFLRANSALRHREFKEFLMENEAQYLDVPYHNAVRWLSKGNVLKTVWGVLEHITTFLAAIEPTAAVNSFIEFLSSEDDLMMVAFMVDIFGHLNEFNLSLQGKNKVIADMRKEVKAFEMKLHLFRQDIENSKLLHFPTLKEYQSKTGATDTDMSQFMTIIQDMIVEFDSRFTAFNTCDALLLLIKNPYITEPQGPWTEQVEGFCPDLSIASLQTELINLQADAELKHLFSKEATEDFWIALSPHNFQSLKTLGLYVSGMFGSTWLCESLFSQMNIVKSKYRSKLTHAHLEQILRIATTGFEPDFKKLAQESRAHFSH